MDVLILCGEPRPFVLYGNAVEGIITRADLRKGPVRSMLYALIALLEVHIQRLIYMLRGDGPRQKLVKPARVSSSVTIWHTVTTSPPSSRGRWR